MFWRYLIKFTVVKEKYLDNILSISVCFCCFLGKCHFNMFIEELSKVIKEKYLRLYLKHICVLLMLSVFPANYFFAVRVNNFGPYPYPIVDPLD